MLRSNSLFAILFALSFLFSKVHGVKWWNTKASEVETSDTTIVIGFARVTAEEAESINEENELHVMETADDKFGPGFYIRQVPNYRYVGEDQDDQANEVVKSSYCVIKASASKMESIGKIFVPQSIWGEENASDRVEDFVRQLIPEEPETQPLRFSWMEDKAPVMQMLIPTSVIKDDDLDLWAQCFDSEAGVKEVSEDFINWSEMWEIEGLLHGV